MLFHHVDIPIQVHFLLSLIKKIPAPSQYSQAFLERQTWSHGIRKHSERVHYTLSALKVTLVTSLVRPTDMLVIVH